jgi:DNA invertase Pin-like site-specific DNA recombinase
MDATPAEYGLYLRKSKGRSGISRQRTITTAHVERVGGRVVAEFIDTDRTAFRKIDGGQPRRDGFGAMLAMLAGRPGLGVAAWHADRLTRNSEDTETLIRVCAAGGHMVETPRGGSYDLGTATGRKRLRDDANDAAYEVDHMTERITAMKAEHAAAGRWLGGRRPFGYEADGVTLRVAEAGPLAQAHRDVLDGATLASIARDWNTRGILTTGGQRWRGAEVSRVLQRARNAGLMEHQGQITGTAQWPPVVDETAWRATVAILTNPERKTTPGPGRKHLLTWIARCGVCGGPVFCTSTSRAADKGRERRQVYRCREDTRGHVARDKTTLDGFITRLVIGRLSRPDAAGLLEQDHAGELAGLHREAAAIRELMAERDRLHRRRVITTAMLVDGMRELQTELDAVDVRIAAAGQADVLAPLIGDPAGVWAGLGLDKRRAVVGALMSVTILPTRKGRPAGWRPGQPYFDPDTIRVEWRRKLPGE